VRTATCVVLAGCSFAIPLEDVRSDDTAGARIIVGEPDSSGEDSALVVDDNPPCNITGVVLLPEQDTTEAYYRDPLRIRLTEPDLSARFLLRTADGETLDGTTVPRVDDPATIEFFPTEPLSPLTEYRVTVGFCDDRETLSWTFATSTAGESLTADLAGRAYQLDLENARWIRPAGIGGLVPLVTDNDVLVAVEAASEGVVQAFVAPGLDGAQDLCGTTSPLPAAALSDSWLALPEGTLVLSSSGRIVVLYRAVVSGDFLADGSAFVGGRLAATVDLRHLEGVVSFGAGGTTPEEMCLFIETYGSSCTPCSDGEEVCYDVEVEGITANEVAGPLACVALEDCHTGCATSTCGDPTAGECSG